jgi:hypothetical protein
VELRGGRPLSDGVHLTAAWVVIVTNAIVGTWALAAHWLHALRHRVLWWCTAVAEATVLVAVVTGVVLTATTERQAQDLHVAYGAAALIAVGVLYGYRHDLRGRVHLLYGCGGLFIMGIGLRELFLA